MNDADPHEARSGAADALYREWVRAEWVDYNGHMNVAYYVLVFDHATDTTLDRLGMGEAYRLATGCSVFVGEMHVSYLREVHAGDELLVATRTLESDGKRLVLFHEMRCPRIEGPVAVNEVLCIHVDLAARRSVPWPPDRAALIERAVSADAALPRPERSSRAVGIASRSAHEPVFIQS